MAQEADFHLTGDLTGKVASAEFVKSGAGEINIAYSHDRCTSAWIEYTTSDNGAISRIPILPIVKSGASPHATVPDGAKCKIIACMGAKGNLRARIYY